MNLSVSIPKTELSIIVLLFFETEYDPLMGTTHYETWFDACYRFSEQWSLQHAFEILYKQAVNDGFNEIDAAFESMAALGIYT